MKDAEAKRDQVQMIHPRLVVRVGNYKEEVVLYVRYQAGSKKIYDKLKEYLYGIRIIKDGLEPKIPI